MKIILCIFLLNITASVFGQSVELNGILGQSVKFPAAVEKGGSLMHSGFTIGDVTSGSFRTPRNENYRDRVQWDSSTGLFSLSGLKMEDIGEYKVQNTDQNIITVFQLNVYIPVSKPHVSITHNEHPCTIECTAERGTGATLSWYREGEKKPYVSSRVESAPGLYLRAPVKRSGTYTCEAKNSVSNEKASITVGAHCTAPTSSSTGIIVASVIAAVAIFIAVVFAFLYYYIIRRRQAVRTLRRVKRLLDNVDLHAYDKTDPPNAVRLFIQVKEMLDNLDPHACGVRSLCRVLRKLRQVQMLLDIVDLHDYDETVPPDALRTLIQVKMILDNVDPHKYGDAVQPVPQSGKTRLALLPVGKTRLALLPDVKKLPNDFDLHDYGNIRLALPPDDGRTLIQVKELLNNVDPYEYGETRLELSSDAVGKLIQVKMLLNDLDLHAYAQYIFDHVNSQAYVKELPDDVDPYEYVIKLPNNVDPHNND